MFGLLMAGLLALVPVPATTPQQPPKGPAPQLKIITVEDNGMIAMLNIDTRLVPYEYEVKVIVNGVPQVQKAIGYQSVSVTTKQYVDLKNLSVTKTDGKEIDKDDLPKLLKGGVMVIWSVDGKPVDPAYLSIFKEGMLVFVTPPPPNPLLAPPALPK